MRPTIPRDPIPWPKTVDGNWQIDPAASSDRFRLFLPCGEIQIYPNGDWFVFMHKQPGTAGHEKDVDAAAARAARVYLALTSVADDTVIDLRAESK